MTALQIAAAKRYQQIARGVGYDYMAYLYNVHELIWHTPELTPAQTEILQHFVKSNKHSLKNTLYSAQGVHSLDRKTSVVRLRVRKNKT